MQELQASVKELRTELEAAKQVESCTLSVLKCPKPKPASARRAPVRLLNPEDERRSIGVCPHARITSGTRFVCRPSHRTLTPYGSIRKH